MKILIKVYPNSKENKVLQNEDDSFNIRVKAQAKEGKANKAVITLLAEYFKISKSSITIKIGHSTRNKIIDIKEAS
ncbi:MAG: DUF167 domain-containing protein [Patescibacteria group bacterium]